MFVRFLICVGLGVLPAAELACSSSQSSGGGSGGDAGGDDVSAQDSGATDAAIGDAPGLDTSMLADSVAPDAPASGDAASGTHNPACCVRNASYDTQCAMRTEPPNAWICFCPDGGIDPSCTVNMGTELVCCP